MWEEPEQPLRAQPELLPLRLLPLTCVSQQRQQQSLPAQHGPASSQQQLAGSLRLCG